MSEIFTNKIKKQNIILIFSATVLILLGISLFWENNFIPLALLFGGSLFLLSFSRPEFGLYLLVFFLPVINWNFNYQFLIMPLVDILALIFFVSFLSKTLFDWFIGQGNLKRLRFPFWGAFALFFVTVLISDILSLHYAESLWYALRWILFFYLVYFVLPINLLQNKKIIKNTLLSFLFSAFVVSIFGLISLFFQDWQNSFVRIKPIAIGSFYPIGQNQNLIAETLLPAIFFAIALSSQLKFNRHKKLFYLLAIFFTLIMLGTFSRGAWISLFISSLVFIFVILNKKVYKKYLLLFMVGLLILFPFYFYMYKIQADYNVGTGSNQSRLLMSQIALESFSQKPIWGWGSGEFINLIAKNTRFRAKFGPPLDSHGVWQKIMAENGLAGILSFTIFLFAIFSYIFKISIKIVKDKVFIAAISAGALSIFLFEFVNTSYYKGKMWLPIAVAVASVYVLVNNKVYERSK